MDYNELRSKIKDLLWCIGNQREKVRDKLRTLVSELYPDYSVENREVIVQKILDNIK